jgi:hypothetical protein
VSRLLRRSKRCRRLIDCFISMQRRENELVLKSSSVRSMHESCS